MIIGRIINGFGMGLVIVGSLCNTAAFCLSNWMNYALYFESGPLQWRFPLAFQLIFPDFVSIGLALVPESPRWVLLQDRHDEARHVIARLMGRSVSLDDPSVTAEFLSIQRAIEMEREDVVPLKDVLRFRDQTQNFRRVLLSCGTQFMQQFSGVNALGYYLPTLLQQSVGLSPLRSRLMTGVNGTIYLFSAIACLLIIDRFGRPKIMLYRSSTTGACYYYNHG
ncbi:hypothetical protein ACHAQH_010004 [Verticillium albo-atrum]